MYVCMYVFIGVYVCFVCVCVILYCILLSLLQSSDSISIYLLQTHHTLYRNFFLFVPNGFYRSRRRVTVTLTPSSLVDSVPQCIFTVLN